MAIMEKALQIWKAFCTTYGIRTRDSSVKGRRLNPLTNAALLLKDGKDKGVLFYRQNFFYSKLLKSNPHAPGPHA